MTNKKKLCITNCRDCRYRESGMIMNFPGYALFKLSHCKRMSNDPFDEYQIDTLVEGIPDWCPLEDML